MAESKYNPHPTATEGCRGPWRSVTRGLCKGLEGRGDLLGCHDGVDGFEHELDGKAVTGGDLEDGQAPIAKHLDGVDLVQRDGAGRFAMPVHGHRAGGAIRTGLPDNSALATYVTVSIETVHRGALDRDSLVIREPGGRYGDLAHHVDAVPVYRPGERVILFLEPAADGALRTAGMFFGKFTLSEQGSRGRMIARRDLEGQGLIVGRNPGRTESLPLSDLLAVVAAVPRAPGAPRQACRIPLPISPIALQTSM